MRVKKYFQVMKRGYYYFLERINSARYLVHYPQYLNSIGIDIDREHGAYIASSAYFDGSDYSLIHIGKGTVISREVLFLTHDWSIWKAMRNLGYEKEAFFRKPIVIGQNSFIGARVSILPGTDIGENCIVGAGAIIKGTFPPNSIIGGNPATVIGNIESFVQKHTEKGDWIEYNGDLKTVKSR